MDGQKITEQVCMNYVILLLHAQIQVWKGIIKQDYTHAIQYFTSIFPHCLFYHKKVPKYCNLPCCSDIMWSYSSNIITTFIPLFIKRKTFFNFNFYNSLVSLVKHKCIIQIIKMYDVCLNIDDNSLWTDNTALLLLL